MPLVFVCTPYADDTPTGIQRNVRFAEMVSLLVAQHGASPYAPHLLLTRFLHDADPAQREIGIKAGMRVLRGSDHFLAVLPPWRDKLSRGMTEETATATRFGVPKTFCAGMKALDAFLGILTNGEVDCLLPLRDPHAA